MPLVNVKIEVPEGYELTDKEPVHISDDEAYLDAYGKVQRWIGPRGTSGKYFRVRKIKQPPKVEVKLKPGWIFKYGGGVWWTHKEPTINADGSVKYSPNDSSELILSHHAFCIDIPKFPKGVNLMRVK